MLRTRRATLLLTRALVFGTAAPALAVAAFALVGCQDESQPEYWVAKLSDNGWRARAIKQIDQFYEDATTRSNGQTDAPELKTLTEKTVVPLTTTYVEQYDTLDEKTRHRLIRLLAIMRDARTEPALNKAMSEFAEKGRGGEDLKWAARAAADLKLASVSDQLLAAFLKLRADSEEGGPVYRDLNGSLLVMADKKWTKALVDKLEPPMELPGPGEQNKGKVTEFRNQQFWQTTSAQLLGAIGDASGVEPLLKVVLDPGKANVQPDAYVSLVKIGKPAVARASQLISGADKDLVAFAAARARKAANGAELLSSDAPHVRTAAIVLGTIGFPAGAPALIAALDGEKNEQNRAVILRELTKLPPTAETKQAFKSGYPSITADGVIPPGQAARPALAEAATSFFDPELVPWLLQQAAASKKDNEAQSALLVAAVKLMTPDQVSAVGAAVDKYGSDIEKGAFSAASGVLKACGKDTKCYFDAVSKSSNQSEKTQFAGIKAAYMLGIFGNEKVRDQLVAGIDPISNAAIRFTVAKVIDFLSPKGSTSAADQLQKVVDANLKRGDQDKIAGDAPVKQVIYRIRSRVQA